ncbi:hypothetical protein HXXDennis_48 [Xanthomonas phage HXX_Dennis]|nr:hypothetical protein CPT_Suso_047 [Stenotrophomonas phage Suso]UTQ79946.1 hypothetical protein HXXDennis_48 [Xanthomonas phage HXX_Dennis]
MGGNLQCWPAGLLAPAHDDAQSSGMQHPCSATHKPTATIVWHVANPCIVLIQSTGTHNPERFTP